MRIVVFECEVLIFEVEDALHVGIDAHCGQLARVAFQLFLHLLEVVGVDMRVAESMHKFSGFKSGDLCHHHEQQGVGSDVERHAEEDVGAALIEL